MTLALLWYIRVHRKAGSRAYVAGYLANFMHRVEHSVDVYGTSVRVAVSARRAEIGSSFLFHELPTAEWTHEYFRNFTGSIPTNYNRGAGLVTFSWEQHARAVP